MFRENHHPMSFWMEKKVHIWNFPVWSMTLPTLTSPAVENMDMSGRSLLVTLDPEKRWHHIWLVVEPPLWNIWVRQLGSLFPIYGKK